MSEENYSQQQQFPYISTTSTTADQFVDTIKSFLENNRISTIGPFSIEVRQTADDSSRLHLEGELSASSNQSMNDIGIADYNFASENDFELNLPRDINFDDPDFHDMLLQDDIVQGSSVGTTNFDDLFTQNDSIFSYTTPASDSFILGSLGECPSKTQSQIPEIRNMAFNDISTPEPRMRHSSQSDLYNLPMNASEGGCGDRPSLTAPTNSVSGHATFNPDIAAAFNGLAELRRSGGREDLLNFSDMVQFQTPSNTSEMNSGSESPASFEPHLARPIVRDMSESASKTPFVEETVPSTPQMEGLSSDGAPLIVASMARNIIREDHIMMLETDLPRWKKDGLWGNSPTLPWNGDTSTYGKLELAYSCVCQLDMRMGDNAIRSRMALILLHSEYENTYRIWKVSQRSRLNELTSVGRGDATPIIDNILENTHEGWESFDHRRRTELRGKFHNRKRYGKRWLILVDALGPSILFLCSAKLANMIRNTTITVKMLQEIAHDVKTNQLDVMNLLQMTNPIASSLFRNDGYEDHDVEKLLTQLRSNGPTFQVDQEMPSAGDSPIYTST